MCQTNVPEVTYADISPILLRSCSPCHYPDQDGKLLALDNYTQVKKHLSKMLRRVELPQDNPKFMPYELQREALSADEITRLKNWAQGGYRRGDNHLQSSTFADGQPNQKNADEQCRVWLRVHRRSCLLPVTCDQFPGGRHWISQSIGLAGIPGVSCVGDDASVRLASCDLPLVT
ncbi:MAG: hypothetical protein IPJ06_11820 [Saprospiraceae bacterium]|nr:hypothetical protein [Saprospiraceae bacterium]